MPKKEIDYSKTVMYKIVCNDLNVKDVYVGHTTDFTKRKAKHKYDCVNSNSKSYNYKIFKIMRKNESWNNWSMIEVEKYPCNDKNEARLRERYWYELLNANMNSQAPTFDIENKKEYMKKYVEAHKNEIKEYMKNYNAEYSKANYQAHKERNSEKKTCDVCGKLYINKTNHNKTRFHNNAIKK